MSIYTKIQQLALDTIDFKNKAAEAAFETLCASLGAAQESALLVDQLKGGTNVDDAISGVFNLANAFGGVYNDLTSAQKEMVVKGVSDLIYFPDNRALEASVEGLFNASVNMISGAKALNDLVDTIAPPEEDPQ